MGDVKALSGKEAVERVTKIAKDEIGMVTTFLPAGMRSRPMNTSGIDADGTFWFMSHKEGEVDREIIANQNVSLVYAVISRSEYLELEGTATITQDRAKIDELWNPMMKTWFHGGKDDPNLTLIRFTPRRGYYWDTKHGKFVQFAKIAVGTVTGKELDDGIEGALSFG